MLLAVDIGNTNVVLGLYAGEELRHTFRISTVRSRTEDEYGILLLELLRLRQIEPVEIDASIIASVVPPLTDVMRHAILQAFGHEALLVEPGLKTGIAVLHENPREVGADRIVNAVAAYERVHNSVIVVDMGTATTFDCISPKGEYLGGVIAPGVEVSLDGLLKHAAKLSRIEIAVPPKIVGRNTTHALQSGLIHGHAAMLDGMIDRLEKELGFACHVIATGGLSPLIARHTQHPCEVDLHLTLRGLRIIYDRNLNARRNQGTRKP